ncbi:hypothetical protein [Sinomonas gamaensis]|uniref:hypothetical protein n=1 Tax=Sinomonas gamaensis TaxID=2565624 RepID=UPI001109A6C6|nr:hypothetical protein [Sinomonas gamaensis]
MKGWDTRRRSSLGEDILLARHGTRIREFVVESDGAVTSALLDDATIDAVSNLLVRTERTPLDHLVLLSSHRLDSVRRIERAEIRFWGWTAAVFLACLVLVVVLLVAGVLPTNTASAAAMTS